MVRLSACALLLLCLLPQALAQTRPASTTPLAQAAKPAAKKPAAKPKAAVKPAQPRYAGPCGTGVITATQELFTVQRIGLTVFGNEYAEVPVSWGFDDLTFARVRAAAGTAPVRRIAYAKGAFDAFYHPQRSLFRNQREELSNLVRQIASNAGCERYLVIIRGEGQFPGTNQPLTGVGIVNRSGIISSSYLFANVGVIVLDGQTFEAKRAPSATFEGVMKHLVSNLTTNDELRKVDNSMFPAVAADSTTSSALRDGARGFLAERLDKILPAYFQK